MANEKAKQASSGLKKLTDAQKEAIKALYEAGDKRFTEVEKLVNKSELYKITGDENTHQNKIETKRQSYLIQFYLNNPPTPILIRV